MKLPVPVHHTEHPPGLDDAAEDLLYACRHLIWKMDTFGPIGLKDRAVTMIVRAITLAEGGVPCQHCGLSIEPENASEYRPGYCSDECSNKEQEQCR